MRADKVICSVDFLRRHYTFSVVTLPILKISKAVSSCGNFSLSQCNNVTTLSLKSNTYVSKSGFTHDEVIVMCKSNGFNLEKYRRKNDIRSNYI